MTRRASLIGTALLASIALAAPRSAAAAETRVTGGGGGLFPPGTTFNLIPITGLQFGFGLEFSDIGDKVGELNVNLLGIAAGGVPRSITIEGNVTAGSRPADNVATFSGFATVDPGDGTPPLPGVPFAATVTTDANDQGSLGLVIGSASLPAAAVNDGTLSIATSPAP